MAITKQDLQKLLEAGYTLQELTKLAKSDPGQLQNLVNRAGGQGLLPKPEFSRNPFSPLPQSNAAAPSRNSTSLGDAVGGTALGQFISKLNPSKVGSNVVEKIVNPALSVAKGVIGRSGAGVGARAVGKMGPANPNNPDFAGGVQDFSLPDFQAPQLSYRDFTSDAQQRVGGVYAPRYAAIDQAAQNAQGQYQRSDQITQGLYQNLAKNIADIAAKSSAQYKDAQATQASNTNQLVQNQGQNYSSAQAQEAKLLEQLGQQESAKQVLGDNTAEQAYQQSQSQAMGNAQGAAIAAQGQNQQDYLNNVGNADQTAGVSARQNLISQLGNVFQGYDRDRMNLQGDHAQAALQLAQQLSDRDFQAQQANYGVARDQYGAQVDQQKFAYEQALQQAQMRAQQASSSRDQFNQDRQYELEQAKYGTDLATALAQQRLAEQKFTTDSQGSGLSFDNQDPVSKTVQQITQAAGGNQGMAQQYYDFVRSTVANFSANGLDAAALAGNQFQFIQEVRRNAEAKGLDPILAQNAAASYWQNVFGKRQ